MKYFFSLLILFNFSLLSFSQVHNSLQELKLNGKVLSITDKYYVANDTVWNVDCKFLNKTISKFDEKGFLIETNNFDKKEKLTMIVFYTYDKKGYKIQEKSIFPDSTFKEKYQYKYDEDGNEIEEQIFSRDDSLKPQIINHFDNLKQKEPEEVDTEDEKVVIIMTQKYDRLDKQGNWQTNVTLENKIPFSIVLREITYYKD